MIHVQVWNTVDPEFILYCENDGLGLYLKTKQTNQPNNNNKP